MLNDYLGHTVRDKGWIQGFQNLMEYKNDYHKLMPLFDPLHCLLLSSAFIQCLIAFSV